MAPPDTGLPPGTVFRPGRNCCAVTCADRVAFLVDGEAYFDAFVRACERAERSIVILAWDFDSRMALRYDESGKPRELLGEFLNRLCERNPRLRIRILDWDFPVVFGTDREYSPIFGMSWEPHRRIQFRFDDTHPMAGSHHQKIVVIDEKVAFAGGLDLTNKRWDSPAHAPDDGRRTFDGKPYPPFHDVMVAVDGPAARALVDVARSRWVKATGRKLRTGSGRGDPWPKELPVELSDVPVAVACTEAAVGGSNGVHHIEALYLDMIARARRYIYIENQYFTSDSVGKALERRLREPGGPEIVLVTRLLSHGWLEENTMHVLRTRLVRQLREADAEGRFHAYYPHVEGLCEGTCLDLHSKVMVVDDEWARVGSSNLSNRSMAIDSECDVTLEAQGDARRARAIRRFRDGLLAEHSGVELAAMEEALQRHGRIAEAIASVPQGARCLRKLEAPEVPQAMMKAAALGDMETPISLDALAQDLSHEEPLLETSPKRPLVIAAGFLVLLGAFVLMWRYTPLAAIVTSSRVIDVAHTLAAHWWAPLVLMLAYTPAMIIMFPRPLITMAAVVVFGPWEGFAYAMAGVILAGVIGYAFGRLVHRDTVRRLAGPRLSRLSGVLKRRGVVAVTLVRLVPIAPYVVVNVVMGAMRIRLHQFVVGTFLGMMPGALAATVLSDQVATALRNPAHVNPWLVGAAVLALAGLAYAGHRLLAYLDRREQRKERMRVRGV